MFLRADKRKHSRHMFSLFYLCNLIFCFHAKLVAFQDIFAGIQVTRFNRCSISEWSTVLRITDRRTNGRYLASGI